jgi:hypothetical protein
LVSWPENEPTPPTAAKSGARKRNKRPPNLPDRLKNRYLDPRNPLLHAEIKPESNQLPAFELKD